MAETQTGACCSVAELVSMHFDGHHHYRIVESLQLHVLQTMAEAMTPGQGTEAKEREGMLKRIAKLAKQQGSFHLACKKYTQVI